MNRHLLSLACIGLGMAACAGPEVVSLNGEWSFSAGGKPERTVSVPHAWNVDPDEAGYRGKAVYRRALGDLSAMRGRTARVWFEAVYHTARVSVNGKSVGEHVGGYTPFSFDVTDALDFAPGATNAIAVEVDNAPAGCMFPHRMAYDWAADGDIYRDVSLRFTEGPGIRYVHVSPTSSRARRMRSSSTTSTTNTTSRSAVRRATSA